MIKHSWKIQVFDLAKYNSHFDIDHRTAKLAAYIIYQYINY
ncbi:arginase family enzyme [Acinetobacter baylyi]|uniref:Arginase family enzyme n=1 Tax=Acinetobacter baylyi TaxID=202950 RepID=A0ABU0UU72_ACIBI|nr:arginase family enzyme [Acinetobacter baylyi]MDR6104832.1 arginase family enzyme [Acinetobacter baylyi]MDR6184966.1 arginase family enzyme [Acinetobacter baylyi]